MLDNTFEIMINKTSAGSIVLETDAPFEIVDLAVALAKKASMDYDGIMEVIRIAGFKVEEFQVGKTYNL